MEQLLRLLPVILAAAQRIPELQQILPLLTQLGKTTFPEVPDQQAPTAAATTLDANGVKWVQTALNVLGFHIEVDGLYGPTTKATVRQFQKANGLQDDGWAGTKTCEALRAALLAKSK